jgi:hypothetical protein
MLKVKTLLLVAVCSVWFSALAHADTITMNFTGDNEVTYAGLYSAGGNLLEAFTMPYTPGKLAGNWNDSYTETLGYALQQNTTYYIVAAVQNYTADSSAYETVAGGSATSTNPIAFLGDYTVKSPYLNTTVDSSATWTAADDTISPTATAPATLTLPTTLATDYGSNGNTSTIWYDNLGRVISNIPLAADWIGYGAYPGVNDPSMLVASAFTTDSPAAATPEPGTLILMGLGLAAVALGRRRTAKPAL